MVIVKRKVDAEKMVSSDELRKVVEKGGSVASDFSSKKKKTILLSISEELLQEIENRRKQKDKTGISRHRWIVEAIQQKLQG